jgi:hypothetical protein
MWIVVRCATSKDEAIPGVPIEEVLKITASNLSLLIDMRQFIESIDEDQTIALQKLVLDLTIGCANARESVLDKLSESAAFAPIAKADHNGQLSMFILSKTTTQLDSKFPKRGRFSRT